MQVEVTKAIVQTEYHLKWAPTLVAPYQGNKVGEYTVVCPPVREGNVLKLTLTGTTPLPINGAPHTLDLDTDLEKLVLERACDLLSEVERWDLVVSSVAIPAGLPLKMVGHYGVAEADHPWVRSTNGITFHGTDLCGTPITHVEFCRSDAEPPKGHPFCPMYAITVKGREMDFNLPFMKGHHTFPSFREAFSAGLDMKRRLDDGLQITMPEQRLGPVGSGPRAH